MAISTNQTGIQNNVMPTTEKSIYTVVIDRFIYNSYMYLHVYWMSALKHPRSKWTRYIISGSLEANDQDNQ